MKKAFEYSEQYDTPVILHTTTRLSHSREPVTEEPRIANTEKPYVKNAAKNVMLPGFARKRHIFVEERMEQLERECSDFDINTIEYQDMDIGIITGGIAYQYVKEAMPQASVLKLGIVNPLPKDLITAFAKKVKQLYIVEELEPVYRKRCSRGELPVRERNFLHDTENTV